MIAETSTQEGLLAALPSRAGRVLFAGAEGARRLLPETLAADVVLLYRTVPLEPPTWPECDFVVLASPSAARAYAAVRDAAPAISIGPETTREAIAHGVTIAREATTHDVRGLVEAVERAARAS